LPCALHFHNPTSYHTGTIHGRNGMKITETEGDYMKKIKRAIHIDFHTMPGIEDFGTGFTAEDIAERLKAAHVNYVNVFARCNTGFSYYPTQIGIPYPGMQGDLLGDTIRECHKHGIGVSAYINGGLNHELLLHKPEFMRVDKDGNAFRGDPNKNVFFRSPCMNSGYRAYLLEEIKEVLEKNPDGIFIDCVRAETCYCPVCIEKMQQKGVDITNEAAVLQFAYDTQMEAFEEIRAIVPQEKRLFLNSFPYDRIADITSHFEMECLPFSGWWYDYFDVMAPYFRKMTKERVYMTGRFLQRWGDFGGNKTVAAMEHDVYAALLYGYVPSIGDHMHPRDGLDRNLYEKIGSIYKYVESLEPWTDNTEAVTEVAVLTNKTVPGKLKPSPSDIGAAKMMAELKVCYDLIHEDMDFDAYRLLIIPENYMFSKAVIEKLNRFSGKILSSGNSLIKQERTGIPTCNIWDYITEIEENLKSDCFYKYDGEIRGQYGAGIRMKSDYSIAEWIEPYFTRGYDGTRGYFYIPPKECNGYSAVAITDRYAHIAFPIFTAYQEYRAHFHKKLLLDLLNRLLSDRLIYAKELPSTARASLMRTDTHDVLHIKITYPEIRGNVGIIEEHNILPAGKRIRVKGSYKNVYQIPNMLPLEFKVQAGYTEIILPEIIGYIPVLLVR